MGFLEFPCNCAVERKAVRVALIQRSGEEKGKGNARFGQAWSCSVVGVVGTMLAACATNMTGGVTAESPQEAKQKAVKERATARWQAVINHDAEKAYAFLSAGSKASAPLAVYKGRARLQGFRSVDVESAACEAETCKVKLTVVLEHKMMKGVPIELEETWTLENGQYWYVWRL
jgi:hypothetical protein